MTDHPYPETRWRHYKGGTYRVIRLAEHTETGEALVIYQSDKSGKLWARPLWMWSEMVEVDGKQVPRFAILKEPI